MDVGTRRVLMCLILMVTACLVTIMVIRVDVPPQKPLRLIFDASGCEGARRLGLVPSPTDRGVCELDVKAAVGSIWIRIGNVKIHVDHLIAVREAE